jgi:hypothetical protein
MSPINALKALLGIVKSKLNGVNVSPGIEHGYICLPQSKIIMYSVIWCVKKFKNF